MRSFEFHPCRAAVMRPPWSALLSLLLVSCAAPPTDQRVEGFGRPEGNAPGTCTWAGSAPDAKDAAQVVALRRAVEGGPLYELAMSRSTRAECRIERQDGALTIGYRAANGNWLLSKRDEAIEYTEQSVIFSQRPEGDVLPVLMRTERAAFGEAGCGIQWHAAEKGDVQAAPAQSEDVFRGRACNCQVRIRRAGGGEVLTITFSSAC